MFAVSKLEKTRKTEKLRAKLDSFNPVEKSKHAAYMKYKTRVLSFDKNVNLSEDKRKEVATYGFLYEGKSCSIYLVEIK